MQVMCRRLRPLVATRVRIPTPLASMLASHGIPVEVPYQPLGDIEPPGNGGTTAALNPPPTQHSPMKRGQSRTPDDHAPIRSATDILALDASKGEWVLDARQRWLVPRLQSNIGGVCVCFALLATAIVNVLTMPLLLDTAVFSHPRAHIITMAAQEPSIASGTRPLLNLQVTVLAHTRQ